jgi:hypothetical protein
LLDKDEARSKAERDGREIMIIPLSGTVAGILEDFEEQERVSCLEMDELILECAELDDPLVSELLNRLFPEFFREKGH